MIVVEYGEYTKSQSLSYTTRMNTGNFKLKRKIPTAIKSKSYKLYTYHLNKMHRDT